MSTNDKPVWIVNSLGELGVKLGDRCYFLYKGESIEYVGETHEVGSNGFSAGQPIMWRPVFKREFGECAHPINLEDPGRKGTVSRDDSDKWTPLPR